MRVDLRYSRLTSRRFCSISFTPFLIELFHNKNAVLIGTSGHATILVGPNYRWVQWGQFMWVCVEGSDITQTICKFGPDFVSCLISIVLTLLTFQLMLKWHSINSQKRIQYLVTNLLPGLSCLCHWFNSFLNNWKVKQIRVLARGSKHWAKSTAIGSGSGTLAQHFLSWQISTGVTPWKPTSSLFSASTPRAKK